MPSLFKKVMYLNFKSMIDMIKKKDINSPQNSSLLKKFFGGDTEDPPSMLKAFAKAAPILTKETIKNGINKILCFCSPDIPIGF